MKLNSENIQEKVNSSFTEEEIFDGTMEFWNTCTDIQVGRLNFDTITKNNTWFFTNEGRWLIQSNRAGFYGVKKSDDGIETLPDYPLDEAFIKLKYGKIPGSILNQILKFFKEIMEKHNGAEAFCQVYWDLEENKYMVHVPAQTVSGSSVGYDKTKDLDKINFDRYIFVYECHSHNNMNAFWSGTDNADENDLRIFGVFGHLGQEKYQNKHRIFVGKEEINLDIDGIFEREEPRYQVTIPVSTSLNGENVGNITRTEIVDLAKIKKDETPRFLVTLPDGQTVSVTKEYINKVGDQIFIPENWHNNVNTPTANQLVNQNRRRKSYSPFQLNTPWKQGRKHNQQNLLLPNRNEEIENDTLDGDLEWSEYPEIEEALTVLSEETSQFEDVGACYVLCQEMEKKSVLYPLLKVIEHYTGECINGYNEDIPPEDCDFYRGV